ncbi:MAG TPA: hypothetical protein PLN14_07705 [Candidatus Hydrothermia bacterium]|nr:hypothetical protein [Candidatus Hydrothermia bacterium]
MGNTVQSTDARENRVVIYTAGNSGSSIRLNYTNLQYSTRSQYIGRQQVYKIYTLSFRFVIAGYSSSNLRDILTNCERTLMTRGGTLQVSDGNVLHFFAAPATVNPVLNSSIPVISGDPIRRTILTDVEHGPRPVSFTLEALMPLGAIATWTVEIVTAAEDCFWVRDNLVLGIDAEVSYSIDQNHYTRRTVSGRVIVANFGRNGPTFKRSRLSQADMEALRLAIVAGRAGQNFMDPVRIPPGFIRLSQQWGVDATENSLLFQIVDQEVYRTYPAYITAMDATMTFSISGASAVQYVSHLLEGYVEAPRDVSKTRIFSAAFELIQDSMPFVTRVVDNRPSYVAACRMINHLYRNRLDFSVLVYTPMGAFDVLTSCGVTKITSRPFFPQGPAGSAGLYGSGYRLEQASRTVVKTTNEVVEPTYEKLSDPPYVQESVSEANKLESYRSKLLSFNLKIINNPRSNIRHAIPNTNAGSSNGDSVTYQTKGSEYEVLLGISYSYIMDAGETRAPDYLTNLTSELNSNGDIVVKDKKELSSKTMTSAFGRKKLIMESFIWKLFIKGELRKKIIQAGGMDRFTSYLNSVFRTGNFDNLGEAINDYISKGQ